MPVSKRILDLILASLFLVLSCPIFFIVALGVKMQDGGPVFFRQKRLGYGGRVFELIKFRKFPDLASQGPMVTVQGDVRMTPFGRFLEATKLDELPQLFNIFRKEMSFVGPRPESLNFRELFQGPFQELLNYHPGIFGPNQVKFRNEAMMYPADEPPEVFYRRVLFPQKAEADLAYLKKRNLLTDIYWILAGVYVSIIGAVDWKSFVKEKLPQLVLDMGLISLAWIAAAYLLLWDKPHALGKVQYGVLQGIWIMPLAGGAALLAGRTYSQHGNYFSLHGVWLMVRASTIGFIVGFLLLLRLGQANINYALLPISWGIGNAFMLAVRTWQRMDYLKKRMVNNHTDKLRRILIYGVGRGGSALAKWIAEQEDQVAVGFLDDDPRIMRKSLEGLMILGSERDLPNVKLFHNVTELWVTFQPRGPQAQRIEKTCEELGIKLFWIRRFRPLGNA